MRVPPPFPMRRDLRRRMRPMDAEVPVFLDRSSFVLRLRPRRADH